MTDVYDLYKCTFTYFSVKQKDKLVCVTYLFTVIYEQCEMMIV